MVIGGREVEIRYLVRIRKVGRLMDGTPYELTAETAPTDGNNITVGGLVYKIIRADDTVGTFYTLHLGSPNK